MKLNKIFFGLFLFVVMFLATSGPVKAGCYIGCPPAPGNICNDVNDCNANQTCQSSGNGCCAICINNPCTPSCSGTWCGYKNDGCGGLCPTCKVCGGPTCGSCSKSCGGGTQTCTTSCSSYPQACNTQSCCNNSVPAAPVLVGPANGAQVRVGVAINFDWADVTNWGTNCAGNSNTYSICVSSNQISCNMVNGGTGAISSWPWYTPTVADTYVTWSATSTNGALSATSVAGSVCVEGFSVTNPAYVPAWQTCDANHKRAITCREDCGTDDCDAFLTNQTYCTGATCTRVGNTKIQDCMGQVRGTIFDASNYSGSCPGSIDTVTGYRTGLPADALGVSRTFGFADQNNVAPHPWAPLSPTTTGATGNYSINVYAGTTDTIYTYDFSAFSDYFITSSGPKLTCTSPSAVVPANLTTCTTQPCSVLNDMSFGFNRIYGGWWRALGGSVYADSGIKSGIPTTVASQNLILENSAEGNRLGFLSYGITRPLDIFGNNATAKVSTKLWEKQSKYAGPVYDWGYYNNRFNIFSVNPWNGTDAITYSDPTGLDYQIYKVDSSVASFNFSPLAGEKAIFLVNGDVTITSNITVPNTAFLAVIAKGKITFQNSLTLNRADGWYVANSISIPCHDTGTVGCDKDDVQFSGNGSFVAWGGFDMTRDQGILNNSQPSEKFTYRQDLVTNAPKPMKLFTKLYKPFIP